MESARRERLQDSIRILVESYRSANDLFERSLAVICKELSLDPATYFQIHVRSRAVIDTEAFRIDRGMFSVHFKGRMCFLGNGLPFRLFCRLADQPDVFVSYDELLSTVWDGFRSSAAVRSVVKILRSRLRHAKLDELAAGIDGTVPYHYALHLPT